ncbi:MAG: TatD family nuclease-associated radical SAM protein [Eubacteriales bacterium]|nr:TatD family nuclease-associated radical SAM protein [Eubacteriales bacterium]
MTITYPLGDNLYINMTNRCSNSCDFCIRNGEDKESEQWDSDKDIVGTFKLWLDHEPTVEEVIESLIKSDYSKYKQIVFCGFGEPFERFYDCVKVAKWLKEQGNVYIRANTNGQANLIHNRDVTPDMKGIFDEIGISLNAENAEKYQDICHSVFGVAAYDGLLEFARLAAEKGIKVKMTVVDTIGEEAINMCRKIAQDNGCELRVRELIE